MPKPISKDAYLKQFKGTLPRTEKASRKKSATGPMETSIQEYAEDLCDKLGLKWIHIPNEVYMVIFGWKFKIPVWIANKVK